MGVQNLTRQERDDANPEDLLRRGKLLDAIHDLEKQMIEEAMVRSGGNQRLASEILGITERMLGYRLKHYGLRSF
jgi:transcriptional regulator with GAF, ATPase, and Fis domain